MEYVWIEKYLKYLLALERSFNLALYKYIISCPNTSDMEKIRVYKAISKVVLESISLSDENIRKFFIFI